LTHSKVKIKLKEVVIDQKEEHLKLKKIKKKKKKHPFKKNSFVLYI